VIVQDTRGRFASDGEWCPLVHEAAGGYDTVAWAAGLPCSDGRVGMYGASYFGFTQWAAAALRPPALEAMVPYITWADPLNGALYRGGAFELGIQAHWHLQMGLDVLIRRHRRDPGRLGGAVSALCRELDALAPEGYRSLPLGEFAPLRRQDVAPAFFEDVAAPMVRAHVAPWAVAGTHERVRVPTFNVGGWYDIFLADTIANFSAMRARGIPTKLLIGPWTHRGQQAPIGELNFGFGSQAALIDLQADLGALQLRWFDHWLKGIDSGMLGESLVRIFVMGPTSGATRRRGRSPAR